MPDTADHRVACYQAATERRKAGLPIWEHRIDVKDVWRNEELSFEQRRDTIVARIKASAWYRSKDEDSDLHATVDCIADADDPAEFDCFWDELYDHADADRVWIGTF